MIVCLQSETSRLIFGAGGRGMAREPTEGHSLFANTLWSFFLLFHGLLRSLSPSGWFSIQTKKPSEKLRAFAFQ